MRELGPVLALALALGQVSAREWGLALALASVSQRGSGSAPWAPRSNHTPRLTPRSAPEDQGPESAFYFAALRLSILASELNCFACKLARGCTAAFTSRSSPFDGFSRFSL